MSLNLEEKTELYEAYLSDRARTIDVQIPKGPKISFLKCWDYKGSMKDVQFKTLYDPDIAHKNMNIEEVSLLPIADIIYYQITILR